MIITFIPLFLADFRSMVPVMKPYAPNSAQKTKMEEKEKLKLIAYSIGWTPRSFYVAHFGSPFCEPTDAGILENLRYFAHQS